MGTACRKLYLASPVRRIRLLGRTVSSTSSFWGFLKWMEVADFRLKVAEISPNVECVSTCGVVPYPGI